MVNPLGFLTLGGFSFITAALTKSPSIAIATFSTVWLCLWLPIFGLGNNTILEFTSQAETVVIMQAIAGSYFSDMLNANHVLHLQWLSQPGGKTFFAKSVAVYLGLLAPYVFNELYNYLPSYGTTLLLIGCIIFSCVGSYFVMRNSKTWNTRREVKTYFIWLGIFLVFQAVVYCTVEFTVANFRPTHWNLYITIITSGVTYLFTCFFKWYIGRAYTSVPS